MSCSHHHTRTQVPLRYCKSGKAGSLKPLERPACLAKRECEWDSSVLAFSSALLEDSASSLIQVERN